VSAEELQTMYETGREGPKPFPVISVASFAGRPAPARQWIVRDLIPDRNVTDLSGDGGLGKSLVALQLCSAMAVGSDWLGHMPTPGTTLYVSCEDEIGELHRRIEIIASRRGFSVEDLADMHIVDLTNTTETEFAAPEGRQRIALTATYQSFIATIQRLRPKLAVLDTRADVFGGDEISRQQVRFFIRALRRLCFEHDMAILLLSHPSVSGMVSGSGQSGSTAWGNSVRSRLYLERAKAGDGSEPDPDLRILTTKKANYGPADSTIALRWEAGIFRPEHVGSGGLDRIARDQHIETRFLELLRDFDRQGRHVNPSGGPYYAPKAFALADGSIDHRQFRSAMERLFSAGRLGVESVGSPSRGIRRIIETGTNSPTNPEK
jgi:RecA-family ATPase